MYSLTSEFSSIKNETSTHIFIKRKQSNATRSIFPLGLLFLYYVINPTLRILLWILLQQKLNIWLADYYVSVKMTIMSLKTGKQWCEEWKVYTDIFSMKPEDLPWEKIYIYIPKLPSQTLAQNPSKSNKVASLA